MGLPRSKEDSSKIFIQVLTPGRQFTAAHQKKFFCTSRVPRGRSRRLPYHLLFMLIPWTSVNFALTALSVRCPSPRCCAVDQCDRSQYVHLHGFPWELDESAVESALLPLLPAGVKVDETLLPLDRRARRTGRALIKFKAEGGDADSTALAEHLHGKHVGTRWLEARTSQSGEFGFQAREIASINAKVSGRARQSYCRPEEADRVRMPNDGRDIILLCHGMPSLVADGSFELNNLPHGRVDVLSRCTAAALFVSHSMRRATRAHLVLTDHNLTLSVDGSLAKGLHPDERSMASAIKRALQGHARQAAGGGEAVPTKVPRPRRPSARRAAEARSLPAGWTVTPGDSLRARLNAVGVGQAEEGENKARSVRFLVMHEHGEPLSAKLLGEAAPDVEDSEGQSVEPSTVLVLGDHLGFTQEEEQCLEEMGGVRASVSPLPLLASHCIVLAHAVLDGVAMDN